MSQRRRRRSRDVALVAVPVLALAFTACGGDDDTAYCVDQQRPDRREPLLRRRRAARRRRVLLVLRRQRGSGDRYAPGTRLKRRRAGRGLQHRRERAPRRLRLELADERQRRRPRRRLAQQRGRLMDRIDVEPRQGWPAIIEEQGLIYWKTELPDGSTMPYWHESNAYTLTSDEVYEMEASVRLLMEMLVEAGDYIIESNLFSADGHPGLGGAAHQGDVGVRAADALRPLRLRLRPRRLQDARVQRGHADRAGRDRRPVALGAGRLRRRRRPVEHGPRAARRSAGRSCSRASPATALYLAAHHARRSPARTS